MGNLKPRYWCGHCHKGFKTLYDLQYHVHKIEVKPKVKRKPVAVKSYHCLKCKMRHEEGVKSYEAHMKYKRQKGRPTKK